jgi:hypothetical protein
MKLYRKADLLIAPGVAIGLLLCWWLVTRPSIRDCPTLHDFSPLTLQRSANRLINLGPERAYRLLRSSASTSGTTRQDVRVMLLCRILYRQSGAQPLRPPPFGGPSDVPESMWGSESWPDFPLALFHDIPFLLSESYGYYGAPPNIREYVDYCQSNGVFRTTLFGPTCWRDALSALAELRASERWRRVAWQGSQEIELEHRLHLQIERSVGHCTHN